MRRTRPGDASCAVAYLRVSTEEQHLGPEAQRMAITQWASRAQVTVVAWHSDAGVSGAAELGDRPALTAAFVDVIEHQAGVLVVARRDRLARDVVVAATIERAALLPALKPTVNVGAVADAVSRPSGFSALSAVKLEASKV